MGQTFCPKVYVLKFNSNDFNPNYDHFSSWFSAVLLLNQTSDHFPLGNFPFFSYIHKLTILNTKKKLSKLQNCFHQINKLIAHCFSIQLDFVCIWNGNKCNSNVHTLIPNKRQWIEELLKIIIQKTPTNYNLYEWV